MDSKFAILLQKHRTGTLDLKEELELAEMISGLSNLEIEQFIKTEFKDFLESEQQVKTKNLKQILNQVHHQIRLIESDRKQRRSYQIGKWISRVAATLFLPLLIFSGLQLYRSVNNEGQQAYVNIVAPVGARVKFELPDGTHGTLNSNSKLSYASLFKENRKVKIQGEAYFDVAHDQAHPFVIEANKNEIKVVGTKFTVSASKHDQSTGVVLEEGKVTFTSPYLKNAVHILPGHRLVEKDGQVNYSKVETWKYTAWKDGKLVFRNDSMNELADQISKWYNVDVEVKSNLIADYTFRGVFQDESLEEVLRLLKMTSPIDYKILPRVKRPDGSYTKKKVILFKK